MTEKQDEVMKQVHGLLTEHFDCWVVVVENHDIDDEGHTSTRAMWYGGVTQILGLMLHEMIRIGKKVIEPTSLILLCALLVGCSTPDKRLYKHYRFDYYEPYAKKMEAKIEVRRALPADTKAMRAATTKHIPLTKAKEIREELPIILAAAVNGVTLEWDANSEPDITGYRIYHNAPQDVETQVVDAGNVTKFTLSVSKPRVFRVTAYSAAGLESIFSDPVVWPDLIPVVSLTKDPNNNVMTLTLIGAAGFSYEVFKSDDLITWFTMGTVNNQTGTVTITDPSSSFVSQRFYRAVTMY